MMVGTVLAAMEMVVVVVVVVLVVVVVSFPMRIAMKIAMINRASHLLTSDNSSSLLWFSAWEVTPLPHLPPTILAEGGKR